MSKKERANEKKLINKIIDIYLEESNDGSQIYLKLLDNQLKSFQTKLQLLEMDKPFFFQKKKLKIYNQKIKYCKQKIRDIYLEIGEEIEETERINKLLIYRRKTGVYHEKNR